VLGGIYYDNSVSVSYSNNQVGKFDSSGFKTIDGSESSPSISFIDDADTGIYRPSDNVISFSTDGNETVRMDTDGFKTILGSKTNPSISVFGSKSINVYGVPQIQTISDIGFYFDTGWYGPTFGIVDQLNLAVGGDEILSLNKYGINIFTVGTNVLPSISFTDLGTQPSGINGGSIYVSLVTGQVERFRVEGGSAESQNEGQIDLHGNAYINDNLYLPQPNSSSPSAGKVLTSVDTTGKVSWKTPTSLPPRLYAIEIESDLGTAQAYFGENTWTNEGTLPDVDGGGGYGKTYGVSRSGISTALYPSSFGSLYSLGGSVAEQALWAATSAVIAAKDYDQTIVWTNNSRDTGCITYESAFWLSRLPTSDPSYVEAGYNEPGNFSVASSNNIPAVISKGDFHSMQLFVPAGHTWRLLVSGKKETNNPYRQIKGILSVQAHGQYL